MSSSNLKESIGELLLYLQMPLSETGRQRYWQLFELELRQYADFRFCEVNDGAN